MNTSSSQVTPIPTNNSSYNKILEIFLLILFIGIGALIFIWAQGKKLIEP